MKKWLQVIALAVGCNLQAQGTYEPAITGFAGSDVAIFGLGTAGWAFQPQYAVQITHLGVFPGVLEQYNFNMTVGIWDSQSNLVTSATLNETAEARTDGRYSPLLSPVFVGGAGQTYFIGAYASTLGISVNVATNRSGFTPSGAIGYVGPAENLQKDMMRMPIRAEGDENVLYAGPNFIFYVPEPSAMACFGIGALSLLWFRRNR